MATTDLFEALLALDVSETAEELVIKPVVHALARTATWDDLPWIAARREVPIIIDLIGLEPLPTSSLVRWLLRVSENIENKPLTLRCDPRVATTLRLLSLDRIFGKTEIRRAPGHSSQAI